MEKKDKIKPAAGKKASGKDVKDRVLSANAAAAAKNCPKLASCTDNTHNCPTLRKCTVNAGTCAKLAKTAL